MNRLPPGFRLIDLDRIDGTNAEARRRARAGAEDGLVVRAVEQLSGRGRRGRSWRSPPGNLYMSVVLRPDASADRAAQLSFVSALALRAAIAAHLPPMAELTLKWPNDLLLNGGKLAGILLESSGVAAGRLDWLVIGIGVNLVAHPDDAAYPATSLAAEGAGDVDRDSVMQGILRHFMRWRDIWQSQGFAPIRAEWLAHAAGVSQEIAVRLPTESFRGVFEDLDSTGALIVRLPDGAARQIDAGDVFPITRGAGETAAS